jgi:hypothetical protein
VFVVQVADVAATAARTKDLGGKVAVAPMNLPDGMVVAYLTDPMAACSPCSAPSRKAKAIATVAATAPCSPAGERTPPSRGLKPKVAL